jgi:hypothetical protein
MLGMIDMTTAPPAGTLPVAGTRSAFLHMSEIGDCRASERPKGVGDVANRAKPGIAAQSGRRDARQEDRD